MKRRIFFWLEKLKITPGERKTVTSLVILFVILASVNVGLTPSVPFEDEQYHELEQQFKERTAMLKKKEQQLMQRYHPSEKQLVSLQSDTTPADTADAPNEEPNETQSAQEKININTANQQALESLPGIGPAYARRIIVYRKENGKFKTKNELKKIKGIAQKRLDNLKPFVKL
ncbi:comEA protein [Fodinibius salinus]|uniref:ComEA protein n=1 Tax=Fodinibius salinus TaxID=860790 RepID=A0A5D3YMJ2_9BACT|nr:helix-hairpin-helix domain-containing protein [Fodinibius salinus]TYP93917.1 comEA protein [Fodinibius salinus]